MKEVTQDLATRVSSTVSSLVSSLTEKDPGPAAANRIYQLEDELQTEYTRMGGEPDATTVAAASPTATDPADPHPRPAPGMRFPSDGPEPGPLGAGAVVRKWIRT